jgi:hypothetical protein
MHPIPLNKKRKQSEYVEAYDRHGRDEPLERACDFYNEDGDLIIISSDKVAFKLPAFYLQASSCVKS